MKSTKVRSHGNDVRDVIVRTHMQTDAGNAKYNLRTSRPHALRMHGDILCMHDGKLCIHDDILDP